MSRKERRWEDNQGEHTHRQAQRCVELKGKLNGVGMEAIQKKWTIFLGCGVDFLLVFGLGLGVRGRLPRALEGESYVNKDREYGAMRVVGEPKKN